MTPRFKDKFQKFKSKIPFNITTNRVFLFISLFFLSSALLIYFNLNAVYAIVIDNYLVKTNKEIAKEHNYYFTHKKIEVDSEKQAMVLSGLNFFHGNANLFTIDSIKLRLRDNDRNETNFKVSINNITLSEDLKKDYKILLLEKRTDENPINIDSIITNTDKFLKDLKLVNVMSFKQKNNGDFYDMKSKLSVNNAYFNTELYFDIDSYELNTSDIYMNEIVLKIDDKNLTQLFKNLFDYETNLEENKQIIKLYLKDTNPEALNLKIVQELLDFDKEFYFKLKHTRPFNLRTETLKLVFEEEIPDTNQTTIQK